MRRMSDLARRLAPFFGIDPRGLAVLRIGLGGVLLVDLAMRTGQFRALYTDAGVFPRAFLDPWMRETVVPLHQMGGSFAWQAGLFGIALAFALLLLLGRFTRVASVASWALVVSIQSRQPAVVNFGDDILRMALFWAMFLPLGARWSLDALRRPPPADPRAPLCSVATAAYLLQIAFIYFFTAMLKSGPDWRETGLALYYALHMDAWVTPVGVWLREYVTLTRILTFATFLLEAAGPFLLFAPVAWLRGLTVAGFLGLHLGIAASYTLGIFPWVDLVVLLPFLPAGVWDRVERWLPAGPAPPAAAAAPAAVLRVAGRVSHGVVAALLLYVFLHNVEGLRPIGVPSWITKAGHWLRINQRWAMFTPDAPRHDGWWVMPGTLVDGRVVDLSLHGPELSWDKPARISAHNRPFRWAIYHAQMSDKKTNAVLRTRWAEWRCGEWNRTHLPAERLRKIEMWYMFEETLPIGQGERIEKRFMHAQLCPGEPAPDGARAPASP